MAGRRIRRVAGLTAVAVMCGPGIAAGSTVSGTTEFSVSEGASPQANEITIVQAGGLTSITDTAGVQPTGTTSCTSVSPTVVTCPGVNVPVAVGTGELDDRVSLSLSIPEAPTKRSSVVGGPGSDTIDASQTTNLSTERPGPTKGSLPYTVRLILTGGAGNDLVTGSGGPDLLDDATFLLEGIPFVGPRSTGFGSEGDDTLNGGSGDDVIIAVFGSDTVDAGPGNDGIAGFTAISPELALFAGEDGFTDRITCGEGLDSTHVGRADAISASCESLIQAARNGVAKCKCSAVVSAGRAVLGKQRKASQQREVFIVVRLDQAKAQGALGAAPSAPALFRLKALRRNKKTGEWLPPRKRKVPFVLTR